MKTEKITVDLGEFGKHTLDFSKSFNSNDIEKALREQPANYDWFSSIHCRLKARLDAKHNYLKEVISRRRTEIAETENTKRTKAISQKELDFLVEGDGEVCTVREEIADINYQASRVSGHLIAISQFHSIIKELSKRERSSFFHSLEDQEETNIEKADKRVNKRRKRE